MWLLVGIFFSDRWKGYFKKKVKYNGSEYGSLFELNGCIFCNFYIIMKKYL